ncbi:TetR/AcrR family transcriptional regulator [Williamsia sterculiae]|uniref:Transcriptional regulator, TetR family n=1 Tax=Williamsia sterculiae TaxID=1344003 RepID=A0A1N7GRC1_9NOCA|nr:TetR family transcriptional regulator [Williamsia sterculiae]SIS15143.1 transcriptional regulator, TetR family [Williamsia sterculiae]
MSRDEAFVGRANSLLKDMVVDVTLDLVRTAGWANLRMNAIAERVGVSKPTLYKHFSSKDQLAKVYLDREVDIMIEVAQAAIDRHPDNPERALREGLRSVLVELAKNPVITAVLASDRATAALLPVVTTNGERMISRAASEFVPIVRKAMPGITDADAHAYADTMVRVLVSHAILPTRSVDHSADLILRVAIPVLRGHQPPELTEQPIPTAFAEENIDV